MSDWKNVQYKDGKFKTGGGGGGGGSSTFAGLDDVNFSNLQNGQVPKYNSQTQKWENANESGGGGTVTDVEVDGVSVVNQQGVAEITMPTPPTIPVTDVKVNGTSVVDGNKEAQIKSYKEVTQAEYNALPASKTSDDILYCIKDAGGADGFPPLIYSDEEREVGVWRDGKPLYQKTIIDTTSRSTGTNYLSTGISNIDNIAEIKGIVSYGSDDYLLTIPFSDDPNSSISNSHIKFSSIYRSNGVITFYIGSDFTGANAVNKVVVTIQYTKTTDTAGSGSWTTHGTPTHHYSTTEQVVGTWIDGKPLYQKTFTQVLTNNYANIDISTFNIDKAFIVDGFYDIGVTDFSLNEFLNSSVYSYTHINPGVPYRYIDCYCSLNDATIYITIRYTKTTD